MALTVERAFQVGVQRVRAVLGMARDADRAAAKAFNLVMPALGFHINYRAGLQLITVNKFSRCWHWRLLLRYRQSRDHTHSPLESMRHKCSRPFEWVKLRTRVSRRRRAFASSSAGCPAVQTSFLIKPDFPINRD